MEVDDNIEIIHAPGYDEEMPSATSEQNSKPAGELRSQEASTLESGELKSSQDNVESDYDSDDSDDINVQIGLSNLQPFSYSCSGDENPLQISDKKKDADEAKKEEEDADTEKDTVKGIDLNTKGDIDGKFVIDVNVESLPEKPWRLKNANLSAYFNYGFVEETWKIYQEEVKTGKKSLPPPMIHSSIGSGPPPVIPKTSPGRAPPMMPAMSMPSMMPRMPPGMMPPRMPPGMMPPGMPRMPPGMPPMMPGMPPGMPPFGAPPPTSSGPPSVKTER
jgi:pre-mRNA 3'-end-processing factor FIP1